MKNIIVTGASGEMGKSTCEALIKKNYNVYGLDFNECKMENINFIKVDVRDEKSIVNAFNIIKEKVNKIDAIVHFAGIYKLDSLVEISEKELKKIFDINVFGVYRINKVFMPLFSKNSKILITTSELAPLDPLPFTGIYALTKSTLEKYAYSLRMELQLLDIYVSIIRPGAVKTSMLPISNNELESFCNNTKLYKCNSKRFKSIVDSVETKNILPSEIAKISLKIIESKKPKYVYNINRNMKLRLLNVLPHKLQNKIIKLILR